MNLQTFYSKSEELINLMNREQLCTAVRQLLRKTPEAQREQAISILKDCLITDADSVSESVNL